MNKTTINEEQLKEYNDNGYLILRNVLDVKIIDKLLDFVFHVISLEGKSLIKDKQYSKNEERYIPLSTDSQTHQET